MRAPTSPLLLALVCTLGCSAEAPPEVSLSIAWQPVVQLEAKVEGEGPFVYHWSVDGLERPDLTTDTVESRFLDYGQSWHVEVAHLNVTGTEGPAGEASAEIVAAPSITALVSPTNPTTHDPLEAHVVVTDGFLQTPVYELRWSVDGTRRPEFDDNPIIPAEVTERGQTWVLELKSIDPWSGTPQVISTTIVNSPPTLGPITITPEKPYAGLGLGVRFTQDDDDSDELKATVRWSIDGEVVQETLSRFLNAWEHPVARGQDVSVDVILSDGEAEATGRASTVILNTPPTAPVVALDPHSVTENDPLACAITTPSVDADGDTITYTAVWTLDGVPYTDLTPEGTIPPNITRPGEAWRCDVTASDPYEAGGSAGDGVFVGYRFIAAAAGGRHTCAQRLDRAVTCFGDDTRGQSTPLQTQPVALAAGLEHTCALDADGEVACWGSNDSGQLDAPTGPFTAVAAGAWHTCALDPSGGVVCWGLDVGQLDPDSADSFTALSAGTFHTCGLTTEGAVQCWGWNGQGQTNAPAGNDFVAIAAGAWHTCALHEDGEVTCWGWNASGQALPPAGPFTALAVTDDASCGLREDHTATCWGSASNGVTTPPTTRFTTLDGGGGHVCGLSMNGLLICWGSNIAGQSSHTPTP